MSREFSGNKSKLLIHVGYPKTGSTWLQQYVFNNGKSEFLAAWGLQSSIAYHQFIPVSSLPFCAERVRRVFESGLQEALEKNLIPVLSQEMLVGAQARGDYWGREVAERIHAVFPDARILIVIREQKSVILSSYREHVKNGGIKNIEEFIDSKIKEHFQYYNLIENYQKLFNQNNVLVLPFELLKKDQAVFAQTILHFAGANGQPTYSSVAKNVGYEAGRLAIQRYLNFWCKPRYRGQAQTSLPWLVACKVSKEVGQLLPSGIHERIENHWKGFIAEQVGDYFRESNQKTSQLIKINLADFDYDL